MLKQKLKLALSKIRILLPFILLYFLVFAYIVFGSGPFSGKFVLADRFYVYLATIALVFATIFGYLKVIWESIRPDNKRLKSILAMFLMFFVVYVLPKTFFYGIEPLTKLSWSVLQTALVEEIVFRSLMFGMVLKILQIELRQITVNIRGHGFQIYVPPQKTFILVIPLVILLSMAFSAFHFWDLQATIQNGLFWSHFRDRFSLSLVLYCTPYLLTGQNIYISTFLHYVNNVYAR